MVGSGAARFTMTDEEVGPGLWLIGIGPGDLDHITERAGSVARGCSKRFLEGYTAVLPPSEEERLESIVGKWEKMMRNERASTRCHRHILHRAYEFLVLWTLLASPGTLHWLKEVSEWSPRSNGLQ